MAYFPPLPISLREIKIEGFEMLGNFRIGYFGVFYLAYQTCKNSHT